MQVEFQERDEYAYAVARVRALENRLVGQAALSSLLTVPDDRFIPLFLEATGVGGGADSYTVLIDQLESAYTDTFLMVKGLVLEDEMRRLLSLEYDYRFLGTYLKQTVSRTGPRSADSRAVQPVSGTGAGVGAGAGPGAGTGVGAGSERGPGASGINPEFRKRANLGYQELTSALREGRYRTVGEIMFSAYRSLSDDKGAGGRDIDHAATVAYYREVFAILNEHPNEFLRGYYIRRADSHNIGAMLRLRLQGKKRSELAGQYLPFGTLDRSHLEEGFDAALEGFAGMIVFSPLAPALAAVDRNLSPDEQVAAAERRMDERITGYFRDSLVVVFGIEPLFSYLWLKRMELINLRLVIMGRLTGMSPDDIRKHLREY